MKNIITVSILLFSITFCHAQKTKSVKSSRKIVETLTDFYVIEDKDGYVNLRISPRVEKGNIASKMTNKTVVYQINNDTLNWYQVSVFKNGKVSDDGGYIYKDRMKNINTYQCIPKRNLSTHKVILKKDSVEVVIEDRKFDRKKHKVQITSDCVKERDKVDGKPFWGTDCGADYLSREYNKFSVIIATDTIAIPKSAYSDLFNGKIQNTQVFYDVKQDILYIESQNRDGAGSYDVLWVIEKRKYRERYIFWGW